MQKVQAVIIPTPSSGASLRTAPASEREEAGKKPSSTAASDFGAYLGLWLASSRGSNASPGEETRTDTPKLAPPVVALFRNTDLGSLAGGAMYSANTGFRSAIQRLREREEVPGNPVGASRPEDERESRFSRMNSSGESLALRAKRESDGDPSRRMAASSSASRRRLDNNRTTHPGEPRSRPGAPSPAGSEPGGIASTRHPAERRNTATETDSVDRAGDLAPDGSARQQTVAHDSAADRELDQAHTRERGTRADTTLSAASASGPTPLSLSGESADPDLPGLGQERVGQESQRIGAWDSGDGPLLGQQGPVCEGVARIEGGASDAGAGVISPVDPGVLRFDPAAADPAQEAREAGSPGGGNGELRKATIPGLAIPGTEMAPSGVAGLAHATGSSWASASPWATGDGEAVAATQGPGNRPRGGEPLLRPWIRVSARSESPVLEEEIDGAGSRTPAEAADRTTLEDPWPPLGSEMEPSGLDAGSASPTETKRASVAEPGEIWMTHPPRLAGEGGQESSVGRASAPRPLTSPIFGAAIGGPTPGVAANGAETAGQGGRRQQGGTPEHAVPQTASAGGSEDPSSQFSLPAESRIQDREGASRPADAAGATLLVSQSGSSERAGRGAGGASPMRTDGAGPVETVDPAGAISGSPGRTRVVRVLVPGTDPTEDLKIRFLHRVRGDSSGIDVRIEGAAESRVRAIQTEIPSLLQRLEQSGFRTAAGEFASASERTREADQGDLLPRGTGHRRESQTGYNHNEQGDAFAGSNPHREQDAEPSSSRSGGIRHRDRLSLWSIARQEATGDPPE